MPRLSEKGGCGQTDRRAGYRDSGQWEVFKKRYYRELDDPGNEATAKMAKIARHGRITLVFAAKNDHLNNGAALKEYMEERFFQKR